jgi:hypothetical protein
MKEGYRRPTEVQALRSVRACLLLLLTAIAGCAETPAIGPHTEAPAPIVARVQCGEDGSIEVLTPTVQAQPDGVHIEVEVPIDSNVGFVVHGCCGFNAEDGFFVVRIPPGPMPVTCLVGDQDPGDDSLYHDIRVVDLLGAYIPGRLDCTDATGVGSGDVGLSSGPDPISAAHALLTGLRPTDELVQVGYVESRSKAVVAVRRNGKSISALELDPSDGGWGWIGFENCPDSGISYQS